VLSGESIKQMEQSGVEGLLIYQRGRRCVEESMKKMVVHEREVE
jgi:hypothetical protein